jgi:hypothetical protein
VEEENVQRSIIQPVLRLQHFHQMRNNLGTCDNIMLVDGKMKAHDHALNQEAHAETSTEVRPIKLWEGKVAEKDNVVLVLDVCTQKMASKATTSLCSKLFSSAVFPLQAARVLSLPSHGLAHLLEFFCGVQPDKRFQVSTGASCCMPNPMQMLNHGVLQKEGVMRLQKKFWGIKRRLEGFRSLLCILASQLICKNPAGECKKGESWEEAFFLSMHENGMSHGLGSSSISLFASARGNMVQVGSPQVEFLLFLQAQHASGEAVQGSLVLTESSLVVPIGVCSI